MPSIKEATMRKNAANVINSDGTMGMTRKQFEDKYGMTPRAALKATDPKRK